MNCKCPLRQKIDKSNLTKPQIKKTANTDFNKNPIKGIYAYIIKEDFVEEKWRTFLKISALSSDKVFLNTVLLRLENKSNFVEINFCGFAKNRVVHES